MPLENKLTQEQIEILTEFIKAYDEESAAKKRKDDLAGKVKSIMKGAGLEGGTLAGRNFSLTESHRVTVTKKTKDECIQELLKAKMSHLVQTETVVDAESVLLEMQAGRIAPEFVKKYIKVTGVTTLKLT